MSELEQHDAEAYARAWELIGDAAPLRIAFSEVWWAAYRAGIRDFTAATRNEHHPVDPFRRSAR